MNSVRFEDYFSQVSANYARFRPTYPPGLFAVVARYAATLDCAWDCATGSGQAAVGLSRHFRQVVATEASREQVLQATPLTNVEYRVAPAEASGLETAAMNVVTVASPGLPQHLHGRHAAYRHQRSATRTGWSC